MDEIEGSIIKYFLQKNNLDIDLIESNAIKRDINNFNPEIINLLESYDFSIDIETLIDFFEAMIEDNTRIETGVIFTPMYIADYICDSVLSKHLTKERLFANELKIIDPGCGCGIFLVSAIKWLNKNYNISYREIIEKYLFGIDVNINNIRRCKIALQCFCLLQGDFGPDLTFNLENNNSLDCDWTSIFGVDSFDLIVGNPPYVNTHDLTKATIKFLKSNFSTTQQGTFNIFYAFIEQGVKFLSKDGFLGYIIPNNFLFIKSAAPLRSFLKDNCLVGSIINFGDNMVFKPVRTYNAILVLDKSDKSEFKYCTIDKKEPFDSETLESLEFLTMNLDKLDSNGWNLVDRNTLKNIEKIERQFMNISKFIRTGIATLRDEIFIVEQDENGFFKNIKDEKVYLESDIIKTLYKVPQLKKSNNIDDAKSYIIFPYKIGRNGFEIILEDEMKERYQNIYKYFLYSKEELESRSSNQKKTVPVWYAYGRTQGLNKYGRKLLFPTFNSKPNFKMVEDFYALFCNGYAVFDNDYIDLEILQHILNSFVMEYYIRNTSYSIDGGYFCYQKKYLERFSLPTFSKNELEFLRTSKKEEIDDFLISKYDLIL